MAYEPAHGHQHVTEKRVIVDEQPVVHDHIHGTNPATTAFAINQAMIAVMAVVTAIVLLVVVFAWAPWNSSGGAVAPANNAPSQQQQAPSQQSPQQAPQSAPEQQQRLPQ